MGFIAPDLPDVDYDEWSKLPRGERLKPLARHWVEHGFGTPLGVYILYIVKMAAYLVGAAYLISFTPGLGGLGEFTSWWDEPIVYQKLVVFTLLFEVLGIGCGFGPLTLRFLPPAGGFLYWLRPGTIRLPPWPTRVPGTAGDSRTLLDVGLYVAVLATGVVALLSDPDPGRLSTAVGGEVGLIDPAIVVPLIVTLALLGLRDKTIFLAARGEQYWLTLFIFFFPVTVQIIGFKLVMLALWWGAATSKLNHHFPHVVAVMMSNSPAMRLKSVKRMMYRDPENDLNPSKVPALLAHGGTTVEFLVPLFLVFIGQGGPLTWAALIFMAVFHLHIISTVPMGVPLEWNLFFIVSLFFLFGAHGEVTIYDLDNPLLLVVLLPALLGLPILGNLRPDLVSFLPAMRYYAGNWATSLWLFRDDSEQRLETDLVSPSKLPINQLTTLYDAQTADLMMQKGMAWRSLHVQGRALNGLGARALGLDGGDPDDLANRYTARDGEFVAGTSIGWNFGEGHLHNHTLLEAIQNRCHFAEGDLRVVVLESQPIHRKTQHYRIYDAATGLVEEGDVLISEMLTRQPWPVMGEDYPVHNVTSLTAPLG
ncbi:DUF3556 domain-containing protein [Nocardioides salsibiostraticola]